MTKNAKRKAAKKKTEMRKQLMEAINKRNVSPCKGPSDLPIRSLDEIDVMNLNDYSHHWIPKGSAESHESSSDDDDDNDVEELSDYRPDGYHVAHIGELIDSKYVLLKKLGWGHFSTVWLAFKLSDKQLYALKIQKGAEKYAESAFEEMEILDIVAKNFKNEEWEKFLRGHHKDPGLQATRDNTHNLQMFDQFFHHGMYGRHFTMAFEVLGKNVLSLIKKYDYRGIPLPVVRKMARQLLLGLDYMHRVCGIIHTDLKPENVVFSLTEREKFELLYEHVLCGPLIDLFETNTPIILNSKQLKNQKKKDRKKRKKQAEKGEPDEEQDEAKLQQQSKTEAVVADFSAKIEAGEAKYNMVKKMKKRRSHSYDGNHVPAYFPDTPEEPAPAKAPLHPLKK